MIFFFRSQLDHFISYLELVDVRQNVVKDRDRIGLVSK